MGACSITHRRVHTSATAHASQGNTPDELCPSDTLLPRPLPLPRAISDFRPHAALTNKALQLGSWSLQMCTHTLRVILSEDTKTQRRQSMPQRKRVSKPEHETLAAEREHPLLITGGPTHIRLYKCCAPVRVLHESIVGVGHGTFPGRVKNTQCVYVCAYRRFASESSIQRCIPAPSHPVRSIRHIRTQHTSAYGRLQPRQ